MNAIVKFFDKAFAALARNGLLNWMPDLPYIKCMYHSRTGQILNMNNPKTFNEKLQWLKLHDRNPAYSNLVDKYSVKLWVEKKIGSQYLIPTLGVWEKFDDINFEELPNRFVLKCTHDSGGLVICKDKNSLNIDEARKKITKALKRKYFYWNREWPYKNVQARIIAEQFIEDTPSNNKADNQSNGLTDYKIFCFNGEPKCIQVDYDRFVNHKRNLYTPDWEYMDMSLQYPTDKSHKIPRPQCLEEMLNLARTLSKDIPHVRCDFYNVNNRPLFGEMTFFHGGGFEIFTPSDMNLKFGNWIQLP